MSAGLNTFLIVAAFGGVALVFYLYKKGYTLNMPGIPDSIRNFGHWDKVVGVVAAMIVVFMITRLFKWIFPKLSEAYLLNGGPYNLLILAAAVIALLGLIWPGKTRTTLLSLMGVLVGGAILTALLPAIWEVGFPSASVQTARIQTVRQAPPDPCDGSYRPLVIGPSAVLATPGGRNCMIDFDVREGGVILIGLNGEEFGRPVTKDYPAGRSDFRVIEWRSVGSLAKLNVRYYR